MSEIKRWKPLIANVSNLGTRFEEADYEVVFAADYDALRAENERLQIALCFWMPRVPADDDEIAQRAGDDAFLLGGMDGADVPSAEDLGWIMLRPTPQTGTPHEHFWQRHSSAHYTCRDCGKSILGEPSP